MASSAQAQAAPEPRRIDTARDGAQKYGKYGQAENNWWPCPLVYLAAIERQVFRPGTTERDLYMLVMLEEWGGWDAAPRRGATLPLAEIAARLGCDEKSVSSAITRLTKIGVLVKTARRGAVGCLHADLPALEAAQPYNYEPPPPKPKAVTPRSTAGMHRIILPGETVEFLLSEDGWEQMLRAVNESRTAVAFDATLLHPPQRERQVELRFRTADQGEIEARLKAGAEAAKGEETAKLRRAAMTAAGAAGGSQLRKSGPQPVENTQNASRAEAFAAAVNAFLDREWAEPASPALAKKVLAAAGKKLPVSEFAEYAARKLAMPRNRKAGKTVFGTGILVSFADESRRKFDQDAAGRSAEAARLEAQRPGREAELARLAAANAAREAELDAICEVCSGNGRRLVRNPRTGEWAATGAVCAVCGGTGRRV